MSGSSESDAQVDLRMLYPETGPVPLEGLYLSHRLRERATGDGPFVYTNFVASLDGRIAVRRPGTDRIGVPEATANPRDWRLFLELAAPADALIVSGRLIRELAAGEAQSRPPFEGDEVPDLEAFRRDLGLPAHPALVVISRSLDLPEGGLFGGSERRVILATGSDAEPERRVALESAGAEVVEAGETGVDGRRLVEALAGRGLPLIYSIAGPGVLQTLLAARVLDRIYLTTVLRVLGGEHFATLASGPPLDPPADFRLAELYLDPGGPGGSQQLMQVYDRVG
ncbi:MAG: dihydrofolate reductase family protein [Chromatiales bacterium]|jgi:riboflavin biosynthesis pyrimidine reductase